MREPVPTRCRLIGACLRQYREQAGWTIPDAAQLLGCDKSKISRMETGVRGIIPEELSKLLDEYAPDPGGREALEALAMAGATRGWWEDFRALLTAGYRDIMATEHAASRIAIYAPVGIPELLQAEDYARALVTASGQLPAAVQSKAVAATMARQKAILIAKPAQVTVLLAAAALRQHPGDRAALRAQLRYLAEFASAHPRVTIQLLPLTASLHAAGGSGTFTILAFSPDPAPGLVLADGPAAVPSWTASNPWLPTSTHSMSCARWRSPRRNPPAGFAAWPATSQPQLLVNRADWYLPGGDS
jgi:transcriptional regulator with XRE-family HTH domain